MADRTEEVLRHLAKEAAECSKVLDEHDSMLRGHDHRLDALEDSPPGPTSWWWPSMTQDECRKSWAIIRAFVSDTLLYRYNLDVFPCWYRHNLCLDAITALYDAWSGNYSRKAAQWGKAEWLTTWRRQLLPMISDDLKNCKDACSRDGYAERLLCDEKTLDAFIEHDVLWVREGVARHEKRETGGEQ